MTPQLLVVSGLPASGKTYLGTRLAAALGWPLEQFSELRHLRNITSGDSILRPTH